MKDVISAIKDRSSTRGYTPEALTPDELNALLSAGLQAPTAANRQEVHFTVVNGGNPILAEIQDEMLKGRPGANPAQNFYYGAPIVVILSGSDEFAWSWLDAGIAVENMALAAEGLDLGSLIIGCIKDAMLGEKKDYFNAALGIPEGYSYRVAFAVGHKAVSKEPHEYSMEKNVNVCMKL